MAEFTEKIHYKYLLLEVKDRVATITLNRPEKQNALNFDLVGELQLMLKEAELNPEVKVIVLKANGEAFCAGSDLEYLEMMQSFSFEDNLKDANHLKKLFLQIFQHPKIIIAQMEGHAIAGGAGLVTVCDFAFAVPEAKLGFSEVRIGFIPAIVMHFLVRKLGDSRARELLLSGDLISADTAADYGMINRVVPADSIENEVTAFAQKLVTQNSGTSMAMTKRMIADLPRFGLEEGLNFAAKMDAHARGTDDSKKGLAAFLNEETPDW